MAECLPNERKELAYHFNVQVKDDSSLSAIKIEDVSDEQADILVDDDACDAIFDGAVTLGRNYMADFRDCYRELRDSERFFRRPPDALSS